MSESIRERILQSVVSALTSVAAAQGATLIRSPVTGIARDNSPALLIFPESDGVVARPNDRVERHLVIRLTALARDQSATSAHGIADALLVGAHAALFSNPNCGGLALGLQELDCEWEVEDADADIVALPGRYQITYRTLAADLSTKG